MFHRFHSPVVSHIRTVVSRELDTSFVPSPLPNKRRDPDAYYAAIYSRGAKKRLDTIERQRLAVIDEERDANTDEEGHDEAQQLPAFPNLGDGD